MRLSVCLAIFAFLGVHAGGLAACQDQGAAGDDGPIRDSVAPSKAAALEPPAATRNAAWTAAAATDIARTEARVNPPGTGFADAAGARPFV